MNHHSLIKHGNEKTSSLISGWWDDYSQHMDKEKMFQTTSQILFSDQHLHLQDLFQLAMELMTLNGSAISQSPSLPASSSPVPPPSPNAAQAHVFRRKSILSIVIFTVKINHGEFLTFEGLILMFNGQPVKSTCVKDTSTRTYTI